MLPAWLAASVQVPALTNASVLPLTVQTAGVLDAKPTTRLDVAVAISAAGAVPKVWLPGDRKVMVCAAAATVKVFVTGVAAVKPVLPAWLAVTEQMPAPTTVRTVPLTVHTDGVVDAKLTLRPEVAVATSVSGATPKVWLASAAKLMLCATGCASGSPPPPPHEPSATTASRAQTRRVFRTGWLIGWLRRG